MFAFGYTVMCLLSRKCMLCEVATVVTKLSQPTLMHVILLLLLLFAVSRVHK